MKSNKNHWITLAHRPAGIPKYSDFDCVEVDFPKVQDRQVLLKLRYVSVDPYLRGRMKSRETEDFTTFQIGKPIESICIAEVIESR